MASSEASICAVMLALYNQYLHNLGSCSESVTGVLQVVLSAADVNQCSHGLAAVSPAASPTPIWESTFDETTEPDDSHFSANYIFPVSTTIIPYT